MARPGKKGSKPLAVYTIVEREDSEDDIWCRIGIAFTNKDSSVNAYLNAFPVNGKIHIREAPVRDDNDRQRQQRQRLTNKGLNSWQRIRTKDGGSHVLGGTLNPSPFKRGSTTSLSWAQ